MLLRCAPYPRYGRVLAVESDERVRVASVQCGDPRCAAEHSHEEQIWKIAELEAVRAYQPRALWEDGRKSSPNTPL